VGGGSSRKIKGAGHKGEELKLEAAAAGGVLISKNVLLLTGEILKSGWIRGENLALSDRRLKIRLDTAQGWISLRTFAIRTYL